DSIMLATAQRNGAVLWTQDADFEGLPGVRFFAKR
ncbi:MAG: type II toxin-antitoxin system VapC family toxin, partial [Gammaproteobacteria bacterium]